MIDSEATESGLPPEPTRLERIYRKLRSYWWAVLALGVVLVLIANHFGMLPDLDRDAQLAAYVALASAIGASTVFDRILSRYDQFRVLLVRVGLEDEEAGAWWLSKLGVRELETEQELYKPSPVLWFCRDYDPVQHVATGTWRGTLSDAELLRGLNTVADLRDDLEDQARRGFLIESNLPSVVNKATRNTARSIIKFFAGEELPDAGEGLEQAVEDVLGELDAKMTFDDLEDDPDLPDHMNTDHVDPMAEDPDADTDSSEGGDAHEMD